ncbi:tumor necrosis factor-like [Mugil cephalus]|uniref:tumor necrosis factor-like n=1 Tax=Mugil cephalus TaxID=48193 RepID=UPI001FB577D6|nr:tumor necrosis factor-like [Mugil cephalus]
MESNSCCRCCEGGVEAGLQGHDTFIQFLRRKEKRLQRMAQFIAVAAILLVSGALALVITVGLGGRCPQSPDCQVKMQPDTIPSDISVNSKQTSKSQDQEDLKYPSAMLTAPRGNNTNGEYLQWDNNTGHAHCSGGFRCDQGDLVVPRKGLYRVFLQITYEFGDETCEESQLKLNSKVILYASNYRREVPILSAIDTVQCKHGLSKSLYTSGLFSLGTNDRLRVRSSYRKYIAKNEYQVFFGAELLPQ